MLSGLEVDYNYIEKVHVSLTPEGKSIVLSERPGQLAVYSVQFWLYIEWNWPYGLKEPENFQKID